MLINFRDFGGVPTDGGRSVKEDRLFRSGHLSRLSPEDVAALREMDFGVVADLRYADERVTYPSPWSADTLDRVIAHEGSSDESAPHLRVIGAADGSDGERDAAYESFYAALPFDRWYRPLFATALTRIAMVEGRVLVHCTAGKDRTGVFAGLILALLGVADADIVSNYMLSNGAPGMALLREEARAVLARTHPSIDDARLDAMMGVKPGYVLAALNAVRATSGSVDAYFREGGVDGMTLDQLRACCLSPPAVDR